MLAPQGRVSGITTTFRWHAKDRAVSSRAVREDFLVFTELRHVRRADFSLFSGRQYNVHAVELAKFVQDAARFVSKAGFPAELAQELPEHLGQKADQDAGPRRAAPSPHDVGSANQIASDCPQRIMTGQLMIRETTRVGCLTAKCPDIGKCDIH